MNSNAKPSARRRSRTSNTAMVAVVYTTTGALCLCALLSSTVAFSPSHTASSTLLSHTSMMPSLQTNNNFIAQSRAIIQENKNSKLYNSPKNDLFPKDEYDKDDFLDEDDDDSFDYTKYDPAVAAQIRKAKKLVSDAKKTIKKNEEAAAKAAAADGETDDTTTEKEASKPSPLPFFAAKTPDSKKIKSKTESGGIIADGEEMASLSKSEAWESRSLSQMFESESGRDYDGNVVEGADLNANKVAERDIAMGIYNLRKKLQTEDFFKVFDKRNRRIGDLD